MSTIAYLKCSNEPDYYTTFDKFIQIEISKLLTVVVGGSTEHFCMLRSGCKVFSWQQNHKCFHVRHCTNIVPSHLLHLLGKSAVEGTC